MYAAAEALIDELQEELPATRRVLERIPDEHLGWRPHPKSMSLGQLALHVAQIPGRIAQIAALDRFDASQGQPDPPSPETAADLLVALDESAAEARAFLEGLDEERAKASWAMAVGGQEVLVLPRLKVMRKIALNHWYHHRGQLQVYLRLLDLPVPIVYGRSADESPFDDPAA
jgi:uncharacterized damage-inducible protein DinB